MRCKTNSIWQQVATQGCLDCPGLHRYQLPNRRAGCARLLILKSIDLSALRVKITAMCESEHAGSGRSVLSNASRHREFSNSAAEFRNRLGRLLFEGTLGHNPSPPFKISLWLAVRG